MARKGDPVLKGTGRIMVANASLLGREWWNKNGGDRFIVVQNLPLSYGEGDLIQTRFEFLNHTVQFTEMAQDERSRVFILGFGPQHLPPPWQEAAQLIIQGSYVQYVLIPFRMTSPMSWKGGWGIACIEKQGLTHVKMMDSMDEELFLPHLAWIAKKLI